jgi:phosphoglycolate phosphatase-like HAD superfamily hydrolase
MLHARALPGRPRHDPLAGMGPIVAAVARDLDALQQAGVDGLLFCNEAAAFLSRRPPPGPSPARVADRITDLVADYVGREGEPMPGVPEAMALFGRLGLRLAIASSSPARLIDVVCARLHLDVDVLPHRADRAAAAPSAGRAQLACLRGALRAPSSLVASLLSPDRAAPLRLTT